ncbi:MAG: DNA methyltransferase [Pirellulaceae bacterium]
MATSRNGRYRRTASSCTRRPKYQPLPDLPPDEYEALKRDIAENGLQYPLIEDEQGNTLDGHQRKRALTELGVKNYPVKVVAGLREEEKWHYALSVNVKRRNLTTAQKRQLIEQELRRTADLANNWLAEILGVDVKTVQATRKRLESTLEIPKLTKLRGKDGKQRTAKYAHVVANTPRELAIAREIVTKLPASCNGRTMDTITAARHARRNDRAVIRNTRVVTPLPEDSIKIIHGPFQALEEKAGIRKNSVHLVLTDIPYDRRFLPQLSELVEFAERILVSGGLFITFSGQYYLPQVMEAFGQRLMYRWLAMSTWSGDSNMIHPLQIASQCKPILIYTKGKWTKRGRWGDVLFSEGKEKNWHPHQQSLDDVERLVSYFSEPKNLIVDPCAGGFTTAVACRNLGRRFVGCDAEKQHVVAGQKRLRECE